MTLYILRLGIAGNNEKLPSYSAETIEMVCEHFDFDAQDSFCDTT